MGPESKNQDKNQTRQPGQQESGASKQHPSQQQRQQAGQKTGQAGQRIDTDNDGRTRDPNDKRPTDQGGKLPPVHR